MAIDPKVLDAARKAFPAAGNAGAFIPLGAVVHEGQSYTMPAEAVGLIGMLHLFGFRLPETNHFWLFCQSFTDLWRRMNIYVKDIQGRYLMDNLSHQKQIGEADPQKIVGKTTADFFPPDVAKRYEQDDRSVIQSGQPLIDREEVYGQDGGKQQPQQRRPGLGVEE